MLENKLDLLIIEGTATTDELQQAWNGIYVESLKLSQGESYNEILELSRDIEDIHAKINIVNSIVKHLQLSFDQDLVNILNSMALQCNVKEEDEGKVLVDKLNVVIARMKKWFTILSQKGRALERLRSENTGKTDRSYFDDWLDIMSEQKGYHVDERITVTRFYRSMNKIKAQSEREEARKLVKNK